MTYLQSLDEALDLFIEFKFCESDFYFLNESKTCIVATYNFGSVYIHYLTLKDSRYVVTLKDVVLKVYYYNIEGCDRPGIQYIEDLT